jgi:type II secretory pathway component PulJ
MTTTKKIEAFTLSEMIVVLIITSIIVGLAFTVLTLVQKQMLAIQRNFNNETELNLLEHSLRIDFNRYHKITYDNVEEKLHFKSEIGQKTYNFKDDYVVKDQDTFKLKILEKHVFFDGNIKTNGEIDAVKLKTNNSQLFIFKTNDATSYLN